MVVGIGVDVCEVRRMARELAREGGGFCDQVFTAGEIADCAMHRNPARRFAARFAAKEAALKALAIGLPDAGALREVEVRLSPGGAPCLVLHARLARLARERGVGRAHVSLAHEGGIAVASVVLEADETSKGGSHDS